MREIEKLKKMEELSQLELLQKENEPKKIIEKKPVEPVKPKGPSLAEFKDQKFIQVQGLRPPSDRKVKAGMMSELTTGQHLWGKNVFKEVPIASLSKIMTVLVVLDELDIRDNVNLQTKLKINSEARTTPSSVFLRRHPLPEVTVEECLISAMVKSANDSCTLLAQYFGDGDKTRFIAKMNAKARALKMTSTAFYNPHGLPGAYSKPAIPDNTSSARDLMLLVVEAYENRKEIFKWTSIKSYTTPKNHRKPVTVGNTNPLIEVSGVIGLKTGFTNNAGWCFINVDKYQSKVYVSIITGCQTKADRNAFARELMLWGRKAGRTLK